MNALARANLIADLESDIQGGVAKSLNQLVEERGYDLDELDHYTRSAIEERFFTCDQCGWSHSKDEMDESEIGDGFLCKECAEDE